MRALARRRLLVASGAIAFAAAALSLVAMLGSRHQRPSAVEIAVDLVVALSFAATGLIAWSRRRLTAAITFLAFFGYFGGGPLS